MTAALRCSCCDLPVESCGIAYGRRAGVDIKAIDQAVARYLGSTAGERAFDPAPHTERQWVDVERHSDEYVDGAARRRFKTERRSAEGAA